MPGQRSQTVPPARHDHERPPPEEAEGPGGGRHAGTAGPGHGRHRRSTGTAPDKNSLFHFFATFHFFFLQWLSICEII